MIILEIGVLASLLMLFRHNTKGDVSLLTNVDKMDVHQNESDAFSSLKLANHIQDCIGCKTRQSIPVQDLDMSLGLGSCLMRVTARHSGSRIVLSNQLKLAGQHWRF